MSEGMRALIFGADGTIKRARRDDHAIAFATASDEVDLLQLDRTFRHPHCSVSLPSSALDLGTVLKEQIERICFWMIENFAQRVAKDAAQDCRVPILHSPAHVARCPFFNSGKVSQIILCWHLRQSSLARGHADLVKTSNRGGRPKFCRAFDKHCACASAPASGEGVAA